MSKTVDSKNFLFETFEPKQTKNKKIVKRTIRIKRNNNKKITYADLKYLYDDIMKKQKVESDEIGVCVMAEKYLTIKNFEEDDLKPWDDENYYKDRAKDASKFNEYNFIDIIIRN